MINKEQIIEQFEELFRRYEAQLNGQKEQAVHAVRRKAMEALAEVGIPTRKDEEWRFTDLQPLFSRSFDLPAKESVQTVTTEQVQPFLYVDFPGPQLVFVDGQFAPQLSTKIESNAEVTIRPLAQMLEENPDGFDYLADETILKNNTFTALNTAFARDGVVIEVADRVVLQSPINILYLSSGKANGVAQNVRTVVRVGKNAQVRVIETFLSMDDTEHFTNTLTLLQLDENAHAVHNKVQNESQTAFHMGNIFVRQQANSHFVSNNLAFGGKLVRTNILVTLQGEGGETQLNGLYMGNDTQHIDNNTLIDHAVSNCSSRELYQGILNDTATAVFSGKILVRPGAQKTDADQSNNCLLLSDEARIDTKPQLEIYADDVRCTHGATVGQLDADAIFYLRSRGISEQRAKNLLIYSFAERIIDQMKVESVREFVDAIILQRFKENMNFSK